MEFKLIGMSLFKACIIQQMTRGDLRSSNVGELFFNVTNTVNNRFIFRSS